MWDAVRRAGDDRRAPGQFILTGSATPDDSVQRHSGAGPYLVGADEDTADAFLDGYLGIIIDHDIDEVSGGHRNPRLVRRFLHAYAQMTAHPANLSALLKRAHDDIDVGSAAPSRYAATDYLDALRRMRIVDEVPTWDPFVRSSKRLTSTPKRHLGDVSLAVSLLRMTPTRATVYHYREADGRLEVDCIIETRDGDWLGLKIKLGEHEVDKATQSLLTLAGRVARPPKALAVVTATSLAFTREDGVHVIPLGCLGRWQADHRHRAS